MAAIMYHGLQSHLETQIVESRTLRLRLPSPKPIPSQSIDLSFKSSFWDSNSNTNTKTNQEENKTNTYQQNNTNTNGCGWSFLDSLSNISQGTKTSQKETTYVHPNQKRSSLVLSAKSLEICTENLGNESGTDIVENGIEMLSSTSSNNGGWNFETKEKRQEPSQHVVTKKAKTQSFNFPPPLTTIRGSESLRVRPHREDGRLVIEVTKVPPTSSCFQVDRSHGRLRIGFFTNNTTSFEPQEEEEVEEEDAPYENEQISNEEFAEELSEKEMDAQVQYIEEDDEEEETEEEAEEKEECVECDDVMRMEKEEKRRRCKESGENENIELLKWGERLWVATS